MWDRGIIRGWFRNGGLVKGKGNREMRKRERGKEIVGKGKGNFVICIF